jgi:hypothetical protein
MRQHSRPSPDERHSPKGEMLDFARLVGLKRIVAPEIGGY